MAVVRREYGLFLFVTVLFCCSYALIIPEELRTLADTISGSLFLRPKSGRKISLKTVPQLSDNATILVFLEPCVPQEGTEQSVMSGTVSRLGFGFRFGKYADFQYVIQLGPQTETQPIGLQPENNGNTKRHYPEGILHSQ